MREMEQSDPSGVYIITYERWNSQTHQGCTYMREMEQSDPSGMYIYDRDGTVRPIRGVHNYV